MNVRLARFAAVLSAATLAAGSCALFEKHPPRVLEPAQEAGGGALAVAAAFVAPEDKAPKFFKKTLGSRGILAVQVVVRNDGALPLLIHSANGMALGAGFAGVRLACGADTLSPLHPAEAAAVLAGAQRVKGYRHPGALEIVASPILPPFGAYTLYKEASVGRFYRPLVSHSIYPVLRGGCLGAVHLAPREERRGWLYFESPPEGRAGACELLVRASAPLAAPDTIGGYEFEFSRDEMLSSAERRGKVATSAADGEGFLFSLVREGKRSALLRMSVESLLAGTDAPSERVAVVAAKTASIADVSRGGGRVAVALNFTSKSQALTFDDAVAPAATDDRRFSRSIARIFAAADGTYVVTENGFAYFYDALTRTGVPGTKLTRGFRDAAMADERIFVFTEDKGLLVFGGAAGPRFAPRGKRPFGRGVHEIAGALDGALAIVSRGAATTGDTLAFFDPAAMTEVRGAPLAGRVLRSAAEPSSVVLQLEDGTVLRLAAGPLGSFRIVEAGWLPFAVRALKALDGAFIAVGADGRIASGAIQAYEPGSGGGVESSAHVE